MRGIKLTQGKRAIVDDDLFDILNSFKWHAFECNGRFYARKRVRCFDGKYKMAFLHHYVIGYPLKRKVSDHINGNTLDNRRENLRTVSNRENCLNRKFHRLGNLPGIHRVKNWWVPRIRIGEKRISLGCYKTPAEASKVYLNEFNKLIKKDN